VERSENVIDEKADMHANRKSDESVVPAKRSNPTGTPAAEIVEGRESLEGKPTPHRLVPDPEPDLRGWAVASTAGSEPRLVTISTQGRSRRREFFTDRSVRGAARKGGPYRDP
jgi:hypothetical protein